MPESVTADRTCRYPGCDQPPTPAEAGTGRPPEYCADPAHNRANAWRARRAAAAAPPGPDQQDGRPVETARQRAGVLHAQVRELGEHLVGQLSTLVEELRTVGDPEAVEVELEAVASDAAERVAAAAARASRAELDRNRAEAERAEADAAAEEAVARETQHAQRVAELTDELAAAHEAQRTLAAQHADELARAAEERDEIAADRDHALARVAEVEQEQSHLRDELATLRTSLATITAERDAARTEAEQARAYSDQRVADLRVTYEQEIQRLRPQDPASPTAPTTQNASPDPAGTTRQTKPARRRTGRSKPQQQ